MSRMHRLGMWWNAHGMQQSRNAVGQECTRMQTGPRMQQREMQQVQNVVRMHCNAAYAECNLSRMYQNAIECIASNALRMHQRKCNVNAATEPQRMQRVRNASESNIMLQILNASRSKCITNVSECIGNARMHENSYGQKEHAFRAEIARLPVTLLGVAVRSPIQKKALP